MSSELSEATIRRRAKSGIFFVGSWGVMNLIVGFGGNLVLARLLTPRDFGIVAIGATLMMFTTSIADGGLGSGLIRRERAPDRAELKAALALQLALTLTARRDRRGHRRAARGRRAGRRPDGGRAADRRVPDARPRRCCRAPSASRRSRRSRRRRTSSTTRWAVALRRLRRLGRLGARVRRRRPRAGPGDRRHRRRVGSGFLLPSFRGAAALQPGDRLRRSASRASASPGCCASRS